MNLNVKDFLDQISPDEIIAIEMSSFKDVLDTPVTSVTNHSKKVVKGSLFVAIQGSASDGHQFLDQAVSAGAILTIGEKALSAESKLPYIQVRNSKQILAKMAATFYGNPSQSLL